MQAELDAKQQQLVKRAVRRAVQTARWKKTVGGNVRYNRISFLGKGCRYEVLRGSGFLVEFSSLFERFRSRI